jgi:hypothetical protein
MDAKELEDFSHWLYWITKDQWIGMGMKCGFTEDLAVHLWIKWRIEHDQNFLWAYSNISREFQEIIMKMFDSRDRKRDFSKGG